jgi:TRAP-type C4-dicarboxylate transport system substrate-binding protein
MSRTFVRAITLILATALSVPLLAQAPINIRLATLAPESSPWSRALRTMGAAVEKNTEKRVRLTVYAGTIPSESSAIARMAVDGLQAATLMVSGLAEIDDAFNVFGIPFFFASDAELAHVQQKLTPLIQERLRAKRYHLVSWGNGGWVHVFSKQPIRTVDDVKRARLYTTEGNAKLVQWFSANGFHVVPLAPGEIPKQLALANGAIDAAPLPPVYAMSLQIFKNAQFMLDVRVAPLAGATVITDAAWQKIPAADQSKLLAAAADMEDQIAKEAPGLDAFSMGMMKHGGLQVIAPDPKAVAELRAVAEKLAATQRGTLIPAEVYDLAIRERDAFRKAPPAK